MTEQIGEQLTELDSGDSIVVTIDGNHYQGDVINTKRWMCELVSGFMESGSISIYLKLSTETSEARDTPTEHLLISATEDVPQVWDDPRASFYNPTEDETMAHIGNVEELRIVDGSSESI